MLQNASPWFFPQQNDVPMLTKLNGFFKGAASTSLEAKAGQQVADLRRARDVQARYESHGAAGSSLRRSEKIGGRRVHPNGLYSNNFANRIWNPFRGFCSPSASRLI